MGFKIIREKAAYYAFLLGIPILGVVTFKKIIDLTQIYLSLNDAQKLSLTCRHQARARPRHRDSKLNREGQRRDRPRLTQCLSRLYRR